MEKHDCFLMDDLTKLICEAYIKCGYGWMKMYNTQAFLRGLCDKTALLTVEEFYEEGMKRTYGEDFEGTE